MASMGGGAARRSFEEAAWERARDTRAMAQGITIQYGIVIAWMAGELDTQTAAAAIGVPITDLIRMRRDVARIGAEQARELVAAGKTVVGLTSQEMAHEVMGLIAREN